MSYFATDAVSETFETAMAPGALAVGDAATVGLVTIDVATGVAVVDCAGVVVAIGVEAGVAVVVLNPA